MIAFYFGSDTFTLSREIKELKSKFAGAVEEMEIGSASDAELKSRLTDILQSQGLFSANKLVILKNFLGPLKDYPKTEEYLFGVIASGTKQSQGIAAAGTPRDDSMNLVFEQTEKFDRRLKFFKSLQKAAQSREFVVPAGKDLETWIKNYLAESGFQIEREALAELIARLDGEDGIDPVRNDVSNGASLWQVSSELEKLILYHSPPREGVQEGVIAFSTVRDLVRPNISQNIFALTNLFAEGKAGEAQRLLEQMVSSGPAAELKSQSVQIIGALASQIRSLLLVKNLEKSPPAKIASTLGWKEGRVWINSKLARRFTIEKLISMLRDLRALDLRLKTSEEPPKLLLSLFLQKAKAGDTLKVSK